MIELVYRHIRYFVRDKSRVFFSFLSVIVLILLYKLFLEHSLMTSILDFVKEHSLSFGDAQIKILENEIDLWLVGGLLTVSCISNSLGAFGVTITDRERGRIKDFSITSCPVHILYLSYIISTVIITFVFTALLFFLGTLVFGGPASFAVLGLGKILSIVAMILLCSIFSACLLFPFILTVSNTQTFSIISTIVGTFGGFFTGTYIPIGNLPPVIENIVTWFPLTHFGEFFRRVLTSGHTGKLSSGAGAEYAAWFDKNLGVSLYSGDHAISASTSVIYLGIWFVAAIALTLFIAQRRMKRK
jgi:multidrug/hemolysin transport system permease protein